MVVEGTMVLFNSWARILFDTGATHSFITFTFVSSLGLCSETMCSGLVVASPMGGLMVANEVCRSCVVRIANPELTADLVVLDMVGYDINLGMDWLATHHASVDCYKKRVFIPLEDGSLLQFCGSVGSLPTPGVGRQMAYCGFLSDFLGEASEVQGLGQIPVVCEFQEVSLR